MKLVIQIPCYNEEKTLPQTLADLPCEVPGVDEVETLVIDDGSTDRTAEVARESGADHVIQLPCNKGLAEAWSRGLDAAIALDADIIVNTDGDNQYRGEDVVKLVQPIIDNEAELVIGARPIGNIKHFSWLKKRLQRLGSWVISKCAGIPLEDAASGFRAYSREVALMLDVRSQYSHCTETLIRAARRGITVKNVPVRVNPKTRESRLMRNIVHYLGRQGADLVRIVTMSHPLKVFAIPSVLLILAGSAGFARFLVYYFRGNGAGHIQSLIFSAMFVMVGFLVGVVGVVADMISGNHQLIEDTVTRIRRLEAKNGTLNGKHAPGGNGKADSDGPQQV
jgi:glycosyltransferase involved in cell wall biosynthesis